MDTLRNKIGLALLLASIALLVPGLMMDLMTLDLSLSVPLLGRQSVHSETRSILGTIVSLQESGNMTVAFLILLFSVIVPVVKAVVLAVVLLSPQLRRSAGLHSFVATISKWAMADVFVVGVFIAFLSTRNDDNISATLHQGFYFFAAYCIVSILAVQVIQIPKPQADLA